MKPMNMRSLLQPLALTGLSLALAACVTSAPPVVKPVDTTTPAQRLAAVDAAAGPDDKELSVQPLRDSQVEDLRVTAQAQRQANDLAGAASSLDHALEIVASDPAVLQERAELALLQGQWEQAETFARKAVDLGSKTGPLCRRHWATIAQARQGKLDGVNAAMKLAQRQDHYDALVPQRDGLTKSRRQAQDRIAACTVAAPARY